MQIWEKQYWTFKTTVPGSWFSILSCFFHLDFVLKGIAYVCVYIYIYSIGVTLKENSYHNLVEKN
jgi:hypothetical protein